MDMTVTAQQVKELREMTGVGMMDCKKALAETNGDMEAAIDWLRTRGLAKAAKKAGRVAAEGLVGVSIEGTRGAIVEVNSETDFVARNEQFQAIVANIAKLAHDADGDVNKLAEMPYPGTGRSASAELTDAIAKIGENMNLRRSARFTVGEGAVASYIHNATAPELGRLGVLVALESAADQDELMALGKKIAMHVAATNPLSLSTDDLDPAAIEKERAILTEKAKEDGRPENMIAKIVDGQIAKFQREVVLLKQAFVMNPDQTVKALVAETGKSLGTDIKVKGFVRLALGEGVEKPPAEDFAAEVAAAMAGQA